MSKSLFEGLISKPRCCPFELNDDGTFPNNAKLPLLIFPWVLRPPLEDPASMVEALFNSNQWEETWRNGVFDYHHYHSTAHEVLGIFSGSGEIQFGGPQGPIEYVQLGDVIVIPAGVAHKSIKTSQDFGVVGAYPKGQDWDLCQGKPGERPQADQNIARVPLPITDPVYGADGPLLEHWTSMAP